MEYQHMKLYKKTAAILAAIFMIVNSFPIFAKDTPALPENAVQSDEPGTQEQTIVEREEKTNIPASGGALTFNPEIKYTFQNYLLEAILTDSNLDTSLVKPLYSLDGENYKDCGEAWDVCHFDKQYKFSLFSNCEPMKSYLAGKINCFYLKLRITRENGTTYETQPAVIDRGTPQPIPEGLKPHAMFSPAIAVIQVKPFDYFGGYQLTIKENTSAEEILACLPDTLPVKVSLMAKQKSVTDGIVNCPVRWKPLSLPQLTAGESVTIADAAEAIAVPEDTLVTTAMGIFRLDEPLPLDEPSDTSPYSLTDEVRLTLNVISEDETPAGVLSEERAGLELSFYLKPTGATAIRVYTCSEGDSKWTEVSNISLTKTVNAHPSTKNSSYILALDNTTEPYRTYLETQASGDTPTPFFIGFTIEGGVYNKKQLILAWPDTYELPLKLPELGGAGGNHNNAGAGNHSDSTESGQRPYLPHTPEDKPQATAAPEDKPQTTAAPDDTEHKTSPTIKSDNSADEQSPNITKEPENKPRVTAAPDDAENYNNPKDEKSTMNLNIPGNNPGYRMPINQWNENFAQSVTSLVHPLMAIQARTDISAKNTYTKTMANAKANSQDEHTNSVSLKSEANVSEDLVSSHIEKETDKREVPGEITKDKQDEPQISTAVLAIAGLCIAGVCFAFAAVSGKNRILNRLLPRK